MLSVERILEEVEGRKAPWEARSFTELVLRERMAAAYAQGFGAPRRAEGGRQPPSVKVSCQSSEVRSQARTRW